MSKTVRLGIAGLGTVGAGTVKLLQQQARLHEARCGHRLEVVAVSARNKKKKRDVELKHAAWVDDPIKLAQRKDVDVVVELIGGAEGVARKLVEAALKNGKHVVTANKALVAHHGVALAKLAEKNDVTLAFEAAVAGGIPIIKALRDGLAANGFQRIVGILNGTCNYILTTMWEQKRGFKDVLKEAQKLGYAEADPSFDIDGIDTAHKLAILASLAFGCPPAIDKVHVEGIRNITLRDMEFANELGYRIKLLGIAARTPRGVEQRVHPCMVPVHSPIGTVEGVYNGVVVQGNAVGTVMFEGRGAGAGPTASSVVADIMDIARGVRYYPLTLPVAELVKAEYASITRVHSSYYLWLGVIDKPGVLAEVTAIFRNEKISLHSFLQHQHSPGEAVQVVLTTHRTEEYQMRRALEKIAGLKSVKEAPVLIRIEGA